MRACWDATLLVLVQPSPASCATCRGTSALPRVLALTHRRLHKSPCVRQPFAEISGCISFFPLWFLSRKLCPIFVCQFKGSLHCPVDKSERGFKMCAIPTDGVWHLCCVDFFPMTFCIHFDPASHGLGE